MTRLLGMMIISCLVVCTHQRTPTGWLTRGDKVQVKAQAAIAAFRERVPRTEMYFEQAYGYAIFPSVTRVGLGFGGAYGKGVSWSKGARPSARPSTGSSRPASRPAPGTSA